VRNVKKIIALGILVPVFCYSAYDITTQALAYHMETEPEVRELPEQPTDTTTDQKSDELETVVEKQSTSKTAEFTAVEQDAKNEKKQTVKRETRRTSPSKSPATRDTAQDAPSSAYAKSDIIPEFNEKTYIEQRRKSVVSLVEKGAAYLQANPENVAMSAFTFNKEFLDGEIYLFVYDLNGICLAQGLSAQYVWENQWDLKDTFGTYIVRIIIEKARSGGGWITYQWRNATKVAYVKEVVKDGKSYILGAGYYPQSKRDATVSLVRSAVEVFKETIRTGGSPEAAFGKFSYPLGNFVYGDLYLFALDFDGNIMAQGDRPGLIGQNSLEYRDAEGKYVNKEIIKKLKTSADGIWIEYKSKRANKITYAEKVTDAKGKNYFIACGYYPDADREQVIDLVRQGFVYMEKHGKSQAAEEINSKTSNAFRYGDLYLMVYDMKGTCVAHGGNPDFIGGNQWDMQDDDGKYIVREMIKKAKDGGGWCDFMLKNAFWFVYVELVTLGKDDYIIASGLYPISKPETMQLLVKGAVSLLDDNSREVAMGEIVEKNGRFTRGDMVVFVFDTRGICYGWGDNPDYVWRPMLEAKDDDGRDYVKLFINSARQGAGRVTFKEHGKLKYAYLEPLEKDGMLYIVGSCFYK
jgi:signal transduction histidine kinase